MTKVSWWKNKVKRELMGFIITKTNCKPSCFYIHEIMANMQNICISTGSGKKYHQETMFKKDFSGKKNLVCVLKASLLPPFLCIKYQGIINQPWRNLLGCFQEEPPIAGHLTLC